MKNKVTEKPDLELTHQNKLVLPDEISRVSVTPLNKKTDPRTPINIAHEKWHHLTKDSAQFIFSQAQLRLKESIDSYTSIREVAHKIIALIIPIITASVIYGFNLKSGQQQIIYPLFVFSVFYVVAAILLFFSIRHKDVYAAGSNPIDLLTDKMIITEEEGYYDEQQYLNYIMCVSGHIQTAINGNVNLCKRMGDLNNWAILILTVIAPITALFTWLVVLLVA